MRQGRQTNHQWYCYRPASKSILKAASIFYGQNCFFFKSHLHCIYFLQCIEARLPLIRQIVLDTHLRDRRRSVKDHAKTLRPLFDLVNLAVNLDSLTVGCFFWMNISDRPKTAATRLYSIARTWMNRLAAEKGSRLAALEIMRLPRDIFPHWSIREEGQRLFRGEVEKIVRPRRWLEGV